MAIDFQTFLKAEERIEHNWEEAESGMQSALISQVWDSVVPHLRQRANEEGISAEEYHRRVYLTRRILRELCFALHSGGLYAETKPKRFWSHQVVDPIRANDKSRGIEIDTAELCGVAAQYVSQPELRNDATDWLFMDSLVFAELDAFAYQLMSGIGSVNWAFILAGGKQIQYYLYAVSLPVLGFVVRYLAPQRSWDTWNCQRARHDSHCNCRCMARLPCLTDDIVPGATKGDEEVFGIAPVDD